jgi:hypothetical protein
MRAYLRSKDLYKVVIGEVTPANKKQHETSNIIISHLDDAVFDSVITAENEDQPADIWAAIINRFASSSVNNKACVWLKFMRYQYPGNLKEYIDSCRKMMNEFAVVQLGIPDDIISISILAKLSREHWNVVDNIILNESIVFFPSQTLKKLQELVYMKDICSNNSSSVTKVESKTKEDSATALKAETSKKQRSKVKNPCSTGIHNPKATYPEHKCWKFSRRGVEQYGAEAGSNLT